MLKLERTTRAGRHPDAVIGLRFQTGRLVLPKDLQDTAGINPGDEEATVSFWGDRKICAVSPI